MKRVILSVILAGCTGVKYKLQENNDFFSAANRDANYTQGLRLGAEIPRTHGTDEYYAEQLIYTPSNKKVSIPLPGDRPYAGYVATGFKRNISDFNASIQSYGVELGLVGPSAYGKESQKFIHDLLGQDYPQGWDSQLSNEVTVLLTVEQRDRLYQSRHFDFTSLIGVNGGTLFTQGFLGGTLRFGDFPFDPLYNSNIVIFPRVKYELSDMFLFVSGVGRFVVRNLFLDGNTFQSSTSVEKNELVGEVQAGCSVRYDRYNFTYVYIVQSKEYETEKHHSEFGELKLEITW